MSSRQAQSYIYRVNVKFRLSLFLEHIQPFYPLFRRACLYSSYEAGMLPRGLLLAIFSVSASFCVRAEIVVRGSLEVSAACASRVRQNFLENTISGSTATIDDIKTLFLLGLCDFRNSSSRKAWATVGHVTRLAYSVGLHQVDNPDNCALYSEFTTPEEMEEWRYLWWSIFVLDCCCNVTVATPSNIEMDSLRTALAQTRISAFSDNQIATLSKPMFLEVDPESRLGLIKALLTKGARGSNSYSFDVNFNIRILFTCGMRDACNLRRLIRENPGPRVQDRLRLLRTQHSITRLSLPLWYLEPRRSTTAGESRPQHAARLINLFELNLTSLMLALPALNVDDAYDTLAWQRDWDATLGVLEDIVAVARAWDPRYAPMGDPAVCYIVLLALVLLRMDWKLEAEWPGSKTGEDLSDATNHLLRLFLEQFAHYWRLPKILLGTLDHSFNLSVLKVWNWLSRRCIFLADLRTY